MASILPGAFSGICAFFHDHRLRDEGTAEGFLGDMQTRQELYDLLGYTPGQQWDFPNAPDS